MALTKITTSVVAVNSLTTANIADNSIDATKIASNSILTRHIDDAQITTDQILDGTIATADIADDAVTEDKLANAINTSIAAKLPLAGGTMTGTLAMGSNSITSTGTVSSGAITSSANLIATGYRVNEGNSLAGGLFKEKNVTGSGSSLDLSIFAESISNGGNIHFMTGGSATAKATIDSSGNVGIGTDTIANESDHKKLKISGASGTGAGIIEFADGSNNVDGAIFSDDGHLFIVADRDNATASSSIRFRVDGSSEKMRIDSSGNVLIRSGTSSVKNVGFTNNFQIEGTGATSASQAIIRNSNSIDPPYFIFGKSRGTSNGSNTIVQNNDTLGRIRWMGADGNDMASAAAEINCIVNGTPGSNDMPGALIFSTTSDGAASTTERMRIKADGQITTQGDILPGADIIMNSGRGISFAATANSSGSMSNELFDDYEEGTYTATISCASGSISLNTSFDELRYTKIGKLVHVQGRLACNGVSNPTGATNLNLPFTSINDLNKSGMADNVITGYFNGSAVTNGIYTVYGNIDEGSSNCRLFIMIIPATNNLGDNHMASGSDLYVNFTYTAA